MEQSTGDPAVSQVGYLSRAVVSVTVSLEALQRDPRPKLTDRLSILGTISCANARALLEMILDSNRPSCAGRNFHMSRRFWFLMSYHPLEVGIRHPGISVYPIKHNLVRPF